MNCAVVDCSGGNSGYILDEDHGAFSSAGGENYESWNSRKLVDYVEKAGLKGYAPMIVTHKITGKVAPLLTDADLKEMGMSVVGDRLRFKQLILQLGRKSRFTARDKPLWRGEEQRYYSAFEKGICTCFGFFPDDPTTYKLLESSLKIKRVEPARCGPLRCFCCYEYSLRSLDLARVKDVEVINVSAPCPQRLFFCSSSHDLLELRPSERSYDKLVLRLEGGKGEDVGKIILTQVEKSQIIERE